MHGDKDSVPISLDKQHKYNIFPVKLWQPVDVSVPQLLPVVDPRDWYTWSPPGWTPPSFLVSEPESSRFPRTYIYFRVYDLAVVPSNHWCTVKWRQTQIMGHKTKIKLWEMSTWNTGCKQSGLAEILKAVRRLEAHWYDLKWYQTAASKDSMLIKSFCTLWHNAKKKSQILVSQFKYAWNYSLL